MARTLILYEGDSAAMLESVRQLSLILAPSRYYRISDFSAELSDENDVFLIGGAAGKDDIDPRISEFVSEHSAWLKGRQVALFSSGPAATARQPLEVMLDGVFASESIDGENGQPDIQRTIDYALRLRAMAERTKSLVAADELLTQIEEVIASERYCTLCTGFGEDVRGSVISQVYRDGTFYFFCEGSLKYATLLLNDNVCVTIVKEHRGQPHPAALQLFGQARIIYPDSDEYREFTLTRGSNYDRIIQGRILLNGIKMDIQSATMYWSHWRELGYHPRQSYVFGTQTVY
jgi:hypothetical protein